MIITKEMEANIIKGRKALDVYRVEHDKLYLKYDKAIPDMHLPLMKTLEDSVKLLGFIDILDFHTYDAVLSLIEVGDDVGAQDILSGYESMLIAKNG